MSKQKFTSLQVTPEEAVEVADYISLYRKLYGENIPKHTCIINAIRAMKIRLENEDD